MVKPRICRVPAAGNGVLMVKQELVNERAGIVSDDWQTAVLEPALLIDKDRRFVATRIGICVPRQNGKGGIVEQRELLQMDKFPGSLTIHTSQAVDTSMEAFYRMADIVENSDFKHELPLGRSGRRGGIRSGNGKESITFKNGSTIRYATRSKSGRRGFSADLVIFDEAMFIAEEQHAATLSTASAGANPQIWYLGSAVDQRVHENGVVFARLREEAIEAAETRIVYFEWSVEGSPDSITEEYAATREFVELSNPALGIRIDWEFCQEERKAYDHRSYCVERGCAGDWPRTDYVQQTVIDLVDWDALADTDATLVDPVCVALDKSPEGRVSVSAACRLPDGNIHVAMLQNAPGTRWVAPFLVDICDRHDPLAVICDGYGPIGSLVSEIREAGVPIETLSSAEYAQACQRIVDAVDEKTLQHTGSSVLRDAIKAARTRPLGDRWAWTRASSKADISPLVAATLAHSAVVEQPVTDGELVIW